jgi:polysaccharide deacetylase family protein (PEP-CTERM system associated)
VTTEIEHFFTVDVEEHFQVSALERYVPRAQWDSLESRVVENTRRILRMLGEAGQHGTFFTLGWVAERAAHLVREIAAAGHEVASHGWDHRRVTEETPDQFRASVRQSKDALEQIIGAPVLGYRAPSFSIVEGREWALDILVEEGYAYDSSLFPIHRPGYGYAGAQRDPYVLSGSGAGLHEYPPATLRAFGINLPAAGGAYLRLLPLRLIRSAIRQAERRGAPATIYIHPWEIDAGQPRFEVSLATRIRHYGGLNHTEERLRRLFRESRFTSIREHLVNGRTTAPTHAG